MHIGYVTLKITNGCNLRCAYCNAESFPDSFALEYKTGQAIELAARGIYVRAQRAGGGYQLFTGTSFATPHITAVVARLLSINPSLTPFQVKSLLFALRRNRSLSG